MSKAGKQAGIEAHVLFSLFKQFLFTVPTLGHDLQGFWRSPVCWGLCKLKTKRLFLAPVTH